jgi:hypothetical protein
MDQSTHEIQREREQTRAALTEKIELLEQRVRDTKLAVKQKFDYRYQTEHQPWKMIGASVAVGYFLGKLIKPAPRAPRPAPPMQATQAAQVAQKGTIKGAIVGAVVPMLVEIVRSASLRALSSRGSWQSRNRNEARVLTPFRDEPPHYPAHTPSKPTAER